MLTEMIEVTNPKGIHARPSGLLAKTAMTFHSEILLELRGVVANASDIMSILTLGAFCGDVLKVSVKGEDEEHAMEEIKRIFSLNFGESD